MDANLTCFLVLYTREGGWGFMKGLSQVFSWASLMRNIVLNFDVKHYLVKSYLHALELPRHMHLGGAQYLEISCTNNCSWIARSSTRKTCSGYITQIFIILWTLHGMVPLCGNILDMDWITPPFHSSALTSNKRYRGIYIVWEEHIFTHGFSLYCSVWPLWYHQGRCGYITMISIASDSRRISNQH